MQMFKDLSHNNQLVLFYPRSWTIGRTRKGNACFNTMYLNARSILSKLDELHVLCVSNSYDLYCRVMVI